MRFDLAGSDDRELPLILGADAGAGKARGQSRDIRGDLDDAARSAAGPTWSARSIRARASRSRAIRTIGAAILPVNRGFWNFDEIRFDYYRDANSFHEAFKKGLFDVRKEDDPGRWQTGYDFPALRDSRVVKETFTSGLPKPSFNFVFNTRRAIFADIRVREALALLFDFEWVNRSIFFDLYRRSASYFEGSELSAHGRPGRCARARAARAVSRRGARRRARRHLGAAGHRRLGPRPHDPAPRARAAWPRPATSCAAPSWSNARSGKPFSFEILVTVEPRRGAPRAAVRRPAQARRDRRAGAPRRCGTISRRGESPSIST